MTAPDRGHLDPAAAAELAADFLAARRAWAGGLDLRMEAGDDGGQSDGDGGQDGGAGDGDGDGGQGDGDGGQDGDGADQLGDAGKQALDRMKGQRNTARTELAAWKALGLTVDQVKALQKPPGGGAGGDGGQPDVEAIREEARQQAKAEALHERVVDKIEARAAKAFADPEDAVAILLRSSKPDDFVADGKVDLSEIDDALTELLKRKPHLAASTTPPPRFGGGGDGGPRGNGKPPTLAEQIAAAEKAGDIRLSMRLKAQQLTASAST